MTEAKRITPAEARRKVQGGSALLVCAYESEELWKKMRLEGAISLGELQSRLPSSDKGQEIIFYCA
jgi:rhodanese-related sulfurtransferase